MKDTLFGFIIALILLLLCFGVFMYWYKYISPPSDPSPNGQTEQYDTMIVAA